MNEGIREEQRLRLSRTRRYSYTWRNKWITSGAESIDDFIGVYKRLAEKMEQWKEKGIQLENNGGVGDDYALFYTLDPQVAREEGFQMEEWGDLDEDSYLEEDFEFTELEYQISEMLTLRLIEGETEIYVNDEPFDQCKYLFIVNPQEHDGLNLIDSIDEAEEVLSKQLEKEITPEDLGITPEQEFWAHCSNLQAWYEHDYDSRLLHRNLAFPLLDCLAKAGDEKARIALKEEIATRFCSGHMNVITYLLETGYVSMLNEEELEVLLDQLDIKTIDFYGLMKNLRSLSNHSHTTMILKRLMEKYMVEGGDPNQFVLNQEIVLPQTKEVGFAIHPELPELIRIDANNVLKAYDYFTGREVRNFGDVQGDMNTPIISHDGKLLAISERNYIHLLDYHSGRLLRSFKARLELNTQFMFSPDDRLLLIAVESKKNYHGVIAWDLYQNKRVREFKPFVKPVVSMVMSADGKHLALSSLCGWVKIYEFHSGKVVFSRSGEVPSVISLSLTNNAQYLVGGTKLGLKCWEFPSGNLVNEHSKNEDEIFTHSSAPPSEDFFITYGREASNSPLFIVKRWKIPEFTLVQSFKVKSSLPGFFCLNGDGKIIVLNETERIVLLHATIGQLYDHIDQLKFRSHVQEIFWRG